MKISSTKHSINLNGGCCPDCGDKWPKEPKPGCICNAPLMIVIAPGRHIHMTCPVHGDFKVYGPPITYMGV